MQGAILKAVQAIYGFKDDRGEPMNEMANRFLVMVPMGLWPAALKAVSLPLLGGGESNIVLNQGNFGIDVAPNARLTWTDSFAVFRSDENSLALIKQSRSGVTMSAKAEGSEFEHDTDRHQYGVRAERNVGYGLWQHACYVTMV